MFQESSLDFKLVKRICLLQQALDQALDSLDQLRQQVEDHQILESQLVQTEQYSNVQQQIINTLQEQLTEKSDWQNQVLQQLLIDGQTMAVQQQQVLEQLRLCIQQGQTEIQSYLQQLTHQYSIKQQLSSKELDLTSEVMIVRTLTVSLSSQLQTAHRQILELETILSQSQACFAHFQSCIDNGSSETAANSLVSSDVTAPADEIVTLEAKLQSQEIKLQELSHEISRQFLQHTKLKYRCQTLAAERDYYRQQLDIYQQINQDLQEQILHHNRQRDEYEAEIFYWKQQTRSYGES